MESLLQAPPWLLSTSVAICGGFLFLGALFGFIRLLRGPYLVDRIVALDFLAFVAVAFICMIVIFYDQSYYFDVAIVIALLGFLATVAFARYVERRKEQGAGLEELDD